MEATYGFVNRKNAKKLLRWYLAYGVAHFVIKILRMLRQARRMRNMLGTMPSARVTDSSMGCLPEMLKNLHRRHDYFKDATLGLPVSQCIVGPKFDPSSIEVLLRDPASVKHFLKDNFENYTKPPSDRDTFWKHLRMWLGTGIFVARHGSDAADGGSNWLKQRKIASSIFSRGNFNNNMNDVFVAKGKRLCELLKNPAADGQPVDMQAKFFQYTMDSIMQIFFGEKVDTMGGEANQYATAYDTAHRCVVEYMMTSIPALTAIKMLPFPFGPLGETDGLADQLHKATNPLFQDFRMAMRTLNSESRRIVGDCRADASISERKDLLALFVQEETKTGSADGNGSFSTEWLRDVVLNFIIAGRDTTACTLSWMFYILATHPEIQAKVQAEVDKKFSGDTNNITIKDVSASELPYLNGLLYETLRLYPPVPADGKEAVADDILPNGMKIPKHAKVTFMVYAMGRDPDVYPEPEVVKPERWIPFKEPSQFDFPVFQAGPRICVGMNMALFEAKIAASMLLREYSFDMAPGEAEKISYLPTALTMSIVNSEKFDSHNLWLVPRRR